ncbi:MAG: hypothetical protein FD161_1227 [Limisphaerales bacterium]|nr:MAG: hypothetical protein FD161_1227 [Limisphaerales bacterium]TXT49497.1 MAG: hypothetical protein FD140_3029 [Limisphaerales bacterium]
MSASRPGDILRRITIEDMKLMIPRLIIPQCLFKLMLTGAFRIKSSKQN